MPSSFTTLTQHLVLGWQQGWVAVPDLENAVSVGNTTRLLAPAGG